MDEGLILGIPEHGRTWRPAARQLRAEMMRNAGKYAAGAGGFDQVRATPVFAPFRNPLASSTKEIKLVELYTANTAAYQTQVASRFVTTRPVGA